MTRALNFILTALLPGIVAASAPEWDAIAAPERKGDQMNQVGAGSSITSNAAGARLRSDIQGLQADATPTGLWLRSTLKNDASSRCRVVATAIGRENPLSEWQNLRATGGVEVADGLARYVRPGLTEEYRVGPDGIRQDFVVHDRPSGVGSLCVSLQVNGASVAPASHGATLTLAGDGREVAYRRLHVTDASDRVLEARIEVESSDRMRIVVDDAEAFYPVRIDPTFSDSNWNSMGDALAGVSGQVSCAAVDGFGNLFIGGTFSVVGDQAISSLAMWNGSTWSEVSPNLSGEPEELLFFNGDLYVAGNISVSGQGGPNINLVARWDGSSWHPLGGGLEDGSASAMCVLGGDLYVGGTFQTADGNPASRIARWDGSAWSPLGSGMGGAGQVEVRELVAIGTDLYAGGSFETAGGITANSVAKWNGTTWSALVDTNPGITSFGGSIGSVQALAVSGGELLVGGFFTTAGATPASNLAKWNGSSWTEFAGGANAGVQDLVVSASNVFATGYFSVLGGGVPAASFATWDGSAWTAAGTGLSGGNGQGNTIAVSGSDVFVGGNFASAGGVAATQNLAVWSGTAWSSVGLGSVTPSGLNGTVQALAISGNDVFYVGDFTTADGATVNRVAKWDGTGWSALGTGFPSTGATPIIRSVAVASNGDVYVGGSFVDAGGTAVSNIAKWDGTSWSGVGNGLFGFVGDIAISGTDVYVTGSFSSVDGGAVSANNVARWDGTAWSALGAGLDNGGDAIGISPITGDVYVGGFFTTAGGVPASGIARWDGSSWSALGSGITGGAPDALAFDPSGNLWVGGQFQFAGGAQANNIARWDGSSWSVISVPVDGGGSQVGVNGGVRALQVTGSDLYLGGQFYVQEPNGPGFRNLARWNGSSLTPLGSGVDADVNALGVIGSDPLAARTLHVGGWFASAGGQVSLFAANASLPAELPEIAVSQSGVDIADGGSADVGTTVVGAPVDTVFTISNVGYADLTGLGITIGGTDAADFSIVALPGAPVASDGSTNFTLRFDPSSSGSKSATLQIASNDADENPFDISLSGSVVTLPPLALVVDNAGDTDDGDYTAGQQTLREAIARANIGPDANTITFDASLNGTPILLAAPLDTIAGPVTLTGNGADNTVIDAQQNGRVLSIDDGNSGNEAVVVIEGITLQGGLSALGENGGGILSRENLTISACAVTGNRALGPGSEGAPFGGGIYAEGTITIADSTISGNISDSIGGGMIANAVVTVTNTTVSGNQAFSAGGLAIAAIGGGSPSGSIVNCTVVGNTGTSQAFGAPFGGITIFGAEFSMENSIVAGNVEDGGSSDIFLNGPPISPALNNLIGDPATAGGLSHGTDGNILGDGSGGLLALSSIVGPLADNGGTTLTHLPGAGSPAIDAGLNASAAALATDQRGDVRIQGGTVDIGAVETSAAGGGNNDPTFAGYSFTATENQAADILEAKLLAKASDVDGDSLSIDSVSGTSTLGGTVSFSGGTVSYTPPADTTGPDSFTVTITDGNGGSVVGTVDVTITAEPSTETPNRVSLTVDPQSGDVSLLFLGIPGVSYEIQRSFDLLSWTTIATIPAGANGTIPYTDPAPGGSAFYRTATVSP